MAALQTATPGLVWAFHFAGAALASAVVGWLTPRRFRIDCG